jgi:hypothetical protein
MVKNLTADRFILAWLIAPLLSILPWFVLFPYIFFIDNMSVSILTIIYVSAIIVGIPFSLLLENFEIRGKLIYAIMGAVMGPLSMILIIFVSEMKFFAFMTGITEIDRFISSVGLVFSPISGALCGYFYHRIAYS